MPPNTTVPMARWLEAPARRFNSGFFGRLTLPLYIACKRHDENRVLACQCDHEHQSDIRIEAGYHRL
jgi:hypothetical protein